MTRTSCAAVDLGASNGRVVVIDCDGERVTLREARRFDTPRLRDADTGYHCWDLAGIEREVLAGLTTAAAMAPLASVGVDGWGVDHVLLDDHRRPVAPAVSYRDGRTAGMMEAVFAQLPPRRSTGAPASSSSRSTRSISSPRRRAGIRRGSRGRATW